jgi:hypothetical protein
MLTTLEFIHLLASEANEICEKETKKTIAAEHVITALKALGFDGYLPEVEVVLQDHKTQQKVKVKQAKGGKEEAYASHGPLVLFFFRRSKLTDRFTWFFFLSVTLLCSRTRTRDLVAWSFLESQRRNSCWNRHDSLQRQRRDSRHNSTDTWATPTSLKNPASQITVLFLLLGAR